MTSKLWTKEEEETLIELREEGFCMKVIAKKMKRSTSSLYTRIYKLKQDGDLDKKEKIAKNVPTPEKVWTAKQIADLHKWSAEGHNIKRIALRLNMYEYDVEAKIKKILLTKVLIKLLKLQLSKLQPFSRSEKPAEV